MLFGCLCGGTVEVAAMYGVFALFSFLLVKLKANRILTPCKSLVERLFKRD